ncbi:MAG: L-aspartate oxidase [Bdellovibrionales bacterium]|nr:L-aspartate oxidase [Bdellovibrionales bacterium]
MKEKKIIVIGSGLAGLFFALKAAEHTHILLISKVSLSDTNTSMAQGGVAAAIHETDSSAKHFEDTLIAGAGLCDPTIVKAVTDQAPDRIQDLIKWGVQFDMLTENPSTFSLGREGGHSERRILHISDHTGQSLHRHLLKIAIAHPNIEILENVFATDLILNTHINPKQVGPKRVVGVRLLKKSTQSMEACFAHQIVLATGGAGKAYLYTSNWEGATGDGIAMTHRAGARIANLEFMQFHPTCLYDPKSRNFLISEALRGEGGVLINQNGDDFTKRYHKMGSLAPRDIVARAIDSEMKKSGADHVFLDMTHKSQDFLKERFPVIYQRCLALDIDMSKTPIPVVPAAHYLCGGVITNIFGETDIENLYCLGESACTGLHGANRLASNSLLECLVTAHNCNEHIQKNKKIDPLPGTSLEMAFNTQGENADELIVVHHMWDEIRRLMWNYVGIVRSNRRLERAAHRLSLIQQEIQDYYSQSSPHTDIEELRNIAIVAELTVKCALMRKESRGIHFNIDYPQPSEEWKKDTII